MSSEAQHTSNGLRNFKPAGLCVGPIHTLANPTVARAAILCIPAGANAEAVTGNIYNPGAKDHGTIDFGLFFVWPNRVQFNTGNG